MHYIRHMRRLSWVMIAVSSVTKNNGGYAMIHTTFFIFLWTLFSVYQIMLLALCTTQVKKNVRLRFASRGFEPGPSNHLELKHFYPLLFFRRKASSTRHCVGSSTLIELGRNTPKIPVEGSLQLFHTSYVLHLPGSFLFLRLIPLGHASATQFEI